jgi:hypothetical protein
MYMYWHYAAMRLQGKAKANNRATSRTTPKETKKYLPWEGLYLTYCSLSIIHHLYIP